MQSVLKHPMVFAIVSMLWISCAKQEAAPGQESVQRLKVYQDEEIFALNSMVTSEGSILLIYTTNDDTCYFKLTDNEGVEKCTVNATANFGLQTTDYSAEGYLHKVIDENGVFTFFIQNGDGNLRVLRTDNTGNAVSDIENFTNENTFSLKIFGVQINSNGNYLLYGSIDLGSDNRCYFAELTPEGEVVFRSIYTPFASGFKGFSGLVQRDGIYYLGGFFLTEQTIVSSSIFLLRYSMSGEVLSEEIIPTSAPPFNPFFTPFPVGRELIRNANGSLSYLVSANGSNTESNESWSFNFSSQGDFIDSLEINFLEENYLPGISPYAGQGILRKSDGTHIGLGNADFGSLLQSVNPGILGTVANYNNPRYSYLYEVDETGRIGAYTYLQREVFNYISSLDQTSDGRIVAAGTTLSFGSNPQISILWLK